MTDIIEILLIPLIVGIVLKKGLGGNSDRGKQVWYRIPKYLASNLWLIFPAIIYEMPIYLYGIILLLILFTAFYNSHPDENVIFGISPLMLVPELIILGSVFTFLMNHIAENLGSLLLIITIVLSSFNLLLITKPRPARIGISLLIIFAGAVIIYSVTRIKYNDHTDIADILIPAFLMFSFILFFLFTGSRSKITGLLWLYVALVPIGLRFLIQGTDYFSGTFRFVYDQETWFVIILSALLVLLYFYTIVCFIRKRTLPVIKLYLTGRGYLKSGNMEKLSERLTILISLSILLISGAVNTGSKSGLFLYLTGLYCLVMITSLILWQTSTTVVRKKFKSLIPGFNKKMQ